MDHTRGLPSRFIFYQPKQMSTENKDVPPGLRFLKLCARYTQDLLRERTTQGGPVPRNRHITIDVKIELETLVEVLMTAWKNPVVIENSFEELVQASMAKNGGKSRDEQLQDAWQPPFTTRPDGSRVLVSRPTVFMDNKGVVFAWYLPGIFTSRRSIPPGQANFSACWYAQGHGPPSHLPGPSSTLNPKAGHNGGPELLEDLMETNVIIGVLLSLIHPSLFDMQFQVLLEVYRKLHSQRCPVTNPELTEAVFEHWSTPFSGFAIIANRETPLHRDTQGGRTMLDILSVLGDHSGGRLEIPLLNARFVYNPKTAFVLPGYLMQHGASRTEGERVCIASYMRPTVGEGILKGGYEALGPPTTDDLMESFGLMLPEEPAADIWAK
ncbi:hypothetical protein H1R20_g6633, partial [Candolleomyces eurysporus]